MKVFNTTGVCVPKKHYMVNIENRLKKIKKLVDGESYFVINKARQYGKTTTLRALNQYLKNDYHVVFIDFQTFSNTDFGAENIFSTSFAMEFTELFDHNDYEENTKLKNALKKLEVESESERFTLRPLFKNLRQICAVTDKPIVLLIDEIDSATNNQVFLDFLAQLRAMYLARDMQPAFQSVIFAGVYDIKNLKQKIRSEEDHKYNSPWNIAADFNIDMSFSKEEISGMLQEYEDDHNSGMDIEGMSKLIFDYTDGYPFLVSRICQLIDAFVYQRIEDKKLAWTKNGFNEAVRLILSEKNTLFESLIGKLHDYPELSKLIKGILFTGKSYPYNTDEGIIDMAAMFGFIKNQNGNVAVANRIFEIRLYNFFLSEDELRENDIYRASLQDKNQFIIDGCLDMRKVLEKFVWHFHDVFGKCGKRFLEEEGRLYFLLYLRPIINGTGNYYIEAQTRSMRRTDVIVDYRGKQYIIELKLWHGEEYNKRGEEQLVDYLNEYHTNTGYLLSFNFNKNKEIGVHDIFVGEKHIVEAVV